MNASSSNRRIARALATAGSILVACLVTAVGPLTAMGQSNYAYKPGEYVTIHNGLSPDRRFSIATHGGGDDGSDNFHAYLMVEPGHKKIGPLSEIGDVAMDTAADDFTAVWSGDSWHVAITYWADRHFQVLQLYRIENRRAYPLKTPSLLELVDAGAQRKREDPSYWRAGNLEIHWLSPKRFALLEHDELHLVSEKFVRVLGKYAKSDKDDPPAEGYPTTYSVLFSAEAVCELTAGDHIRVVTIKPGKFDN